MYLFKGNYYLYQCIGANINQYFPNLFPIGEGADLLYI